MSDRAEVVIVGGGIMGTSLAFALTRLGVRDVMVLERSTLSAGATGKSGALLRMHYSNIPEATLAYRSLQIYSNWDDAVGGDCGFTRSGLIVTVATRDEHAGNIDRMRCNVAMQNQIGINARVISAEELQEMQPFVRVDDIDVAAYEPDSGYVDSVAATRLMAEAAMRGGARIEEGRAVIGLETNDRGVTGVQTTGGLVECEAVVMAAGAWSVPLLRRAGLTVPVEAQRVQAVRLARPLSLPATGTMTFVDTAAGIFLRNWGPNRSLSGLGGGHYHDIVDPEHFDDRNDADFPAVVIDHLRKRIPAMEHAAFLGGHAGIYDMTPDAHPILDSVDGLDGLYLMLGFSGAGFKKGPAVGQCMAEWIVHGSPKTMDLSPFRLSRFDDETWREPWSENEYTLSSNFGHGF